MIYNLNLLRDFILFIHCFATKNTRDIKKQQSYLVLSFKSALQLPGITGSLI